MGASDCSYNPTFSFSGNARSTSAASFTCFVYKNALDFEPASHQCSAWTLSSLGNNLPHLTALYWAPIDTVIILKQFLILFGPKLLRSSHWSRSEDAAATFASLVKSSSWKSSSLLTVHRSSSMMQTTVSENNTSLKCCRDKTQMVLSAQMQLSFISCFGDVK